MVGIALQVNVGLALGELNGFIIQPLVGSDWFVGHSATDDELTTQRPLKVKKQHVSVNYVGW